MPSATGYSLSGPGAGSINVASTVFTVTLTPAGGTLSSGVITPASTLAGTFSPATVTLSTGTPSATFTFTPTVLGTATISATNNAGLANPPNLSYLATPPVAAEFTLAGDALTPAQGLKVSVVPNTEAPLLVTVTSCPDTITAATLSLKVSQAAAGVQQSKAGLIVDPGTVQSNGTYTAKVFFNLLETDTLTLLPGVSYEFGVQLTTTGGRTLDAVVNCTWVGLSGGPLG